MKADRKLYLTDDGRVVEEGDPQATSLLAGVGYELPDASAEKYGLTLASGMVVIGKTAAQVLKSEALQVAISGSAPVVAPDDTAAVVKGSKPKARK